MTNKLFFNVDGGRVPGKTHRLAMLDCQDHFAIRGSKTLGIVSFTIADGCGSSKFSGFGSKFTTDFLASQGFHWASRGVPLRLIVGGAKFNLYPRLIKAYRQLAEMFQITTQSDLDLWVPNMLFCTAVGGIITSTEFVLYGAGDGVAAVNDEIFVLDGKLPELDNAPVYPAYHLTSTAKIYGLDPAFGWIYGPHPVDELRQLAVGSDSLEEQQQTIIKKLLWTVEQGKLQRQMVRWANMEHFEDDGTIVKVTRR